VILGDFAPSWLNQGAMTSYSLVVSDLHFGDRRCTLHSMKTARKLADRLKEFSPLHQIILLGDILDLQLSNWAQSIEGLMLDGPQNRAVGFRYFINFLVEQTGAQEIVYVPGNHDYKIFDYHAIEKSLITPLRGGRRLSGRVAFFRKFGESFLQGMLQLKGPRICVTYPHHSMRVNRARIILTHGHFFDPTQAFNHEVGKLFAKSGSLTKKEILRMRHDYFRRVSLYQNVVSGFSTKKELREWFNTMYHPFSSIKQMFHHRSRKAFLTRAMRTSIEHYVTFCCRPGRVDGVIFGHTHRPGKATLHNGRISHVWNSGCFLKESKDSPDGSFITILHDNRTPLEQAIRVHLL